MEPQLRKPATFAVALLVALSIAACSGSGGGAPAQSNSFTWEPCTTAKFPTINPTVVDYFGSRLQCSMMQVPIDYQHPSRGHLQIALSRAAAGNPQAKIGSLFMNPGGPGGSGLNLGPRFAMIFDQMKLDTEFGVDRGNSGFSGSSLTLLVE